MFRMSCITTIQNMMGIALLLILSGNETNQQQGMNALPRLNALSQTVSLSQSGITTQDVQQISQGIAAFHSSDSTQDPNNMGVEETLANPDSQAAQEEFNDSLFHTHFDLPQLATGGLTLFQQDN